MRRATMIVFLLAVAACASAKPKAEEKCAPQTWGSSTWPTDSCKQEK